MPDRSSLPRYVLNDQTIRIIKLVAKHLKEANIASYTRQANRIHEYGIDPEIRSWLGLDAFSLSQKRWTEFVGGERKSVPGSADAAKVAWYWLFENYPDQMQAEMQNQGFENRLPNPVAPALHEMLSSGARFDTVALSKFQGHYAVYRPHYLDPGQVMVMNMTCGMNGDPSRFEILMTYPRPGWDEPAEEEVEGYIIPYQSCVLFQGMIRQTKAPFIFILANLPTGPDGLSYERGEGTLLVGASGALPSAYPIAIWRTNQPIVQRVATPAELSDSVAYWSDLQPILSRGIVPWRN